MALMSRYRCFSPDFFVVAVASPSVSPLSKARTPSSHWPVLNRSSTSIFVFATSILPRWYEPVWIGFIFSHTYRASVLDATASATVFTASFEMPLPARYHVWIPFDSRMSRPSARSLVPSASSARATLLPMRKCLIAPESSTAWHSFGKLGCATCLQKSNRPSGNRTPRSMRIAVVGSSFVAATRSMNGWSTEGSGMSTGRASGSSIARYLHCTGLERFFSSSSWCIRLRRMRVSSASSFFSRASVSFVASSG
mmetsp:Transcript_40174/g.124133  ORF Transcript_40174/g.124133 Transcript_40174/m.124133 type:complete len:253 (-) Transcript_40174:1238-1996(-)